MIGAPMDDDDDTETTETVSQYKDYLFSLSSDVAKAHAQPLFLFPIFFVIIAAGIYFITRRQRWIEYALHNKWRSRFRLFLIMWLLLFTAAGTSNWLFYLLKGKLAPEFPGMTISAIKIGAFGLELRQQLATRIPLEQKDLFDCIYTISLDHGTYYQSLCKSSPACAKPYPQLSKQDLISEIEDLKSGKYPLSTAQEACVRAKIQ